MASIKLEGTPSPSSLSQLGGDKRRLWSAIDRLFGCSCGRRIHDDRGRIDDGTRLNRDVHVIAAGIRLCDCYSRESYDGVRRILSVAAGRHIIGNWCHWGEQRDEVWFPQLILEVAEER